MRRSPSLHAGLYAAAFIVTVGILLPIAAQVASTDSHEWRLAGRDLSNTRNQTAEHILGPSNVPALTPKWTFTTAGNVSATPTVYGDSLYFPDWKGFLYAVDKNTGQLIWSARISDYDGVPGAVSRSSPAIAGDALILGDLITGIHKGANLIAVNRHTGGLLWITQVDSHPSARITGSTVVYGNVAYQGVSSGEELLAETPSYACCTFRGSVVAVDVSTGRMLWKTYDMPDNGGAPGGYSGGGIWQSPSIDPERKVLYVGTGDNYSVPDNVEDCQKANPAAIDCAPPEDHFDSVLALSLKTGAVKWSSRLWAYDTYNNACTLKPQGANCPAPRGPDFDFGGSSSNLAGNLLGIGQKSGIYWALNPSNGSVLWETQVGPGGTQGGIQWGTAADGRRIYVAITNNNTYAYTLKSGQTINWGSWSALDRTTGKILWQTPDPTPGALDAGAMTVANGVVYAGSMSGYMYALNAATGAILWSFNSGGSVIGGPAIVDGVLYWGTGYAGIHGTSMNKMYAFSLPQGALRRVE